VRDERRFYKKVTLVGNEVRFVQRLAVTLKYMKTNDVAVYRNGLRNRDLFAPCAMHDAPRS